MKNLTLGYVLINRGRADIQVLARAQEFIDQNPSFIMILDESDATDKHLGLDGRKIFEQLQSRYPQFHYHISNDLDVGINIVTSSDISTVDINYVLINKKNLQSPQGKSEHYKHFKVSFKSRLITPLGDMKGVLVVAQHNSAFLRPFTRSMQSESAMKELVQLQKDNPEYLSVLVRDQNTMIPGEGRNERRLRRKYNLDCVTDRTSWEYNLDYLEGDTGGLNGLAVWFNKICGFKVLRKVITIADKIESMCIVKDYDKKFNLKLTPSHYHIDNLDHGIISVKIENQPNL